MIENFSKRIKKKSDLQFWVMFFFLNVKQIKALYLKWFSFSFFSFFVGNSNICEFTSPSVILRNMNRPKLIQRLFLCSDIQWKRFIFLLKRGNILLKKDSVIFNCFFSFLKKRKLSIFQILKILERLGKCVFWFLGEKKKLKKIKASHKEVYLKKYMWLYFAIHFFSL